jgi:LysR family transcriptional regulator, regulator for metE and metH
VRDLRVALAVAEAGSTSKAAAVLHLSQPAVSRALLSLEEKLATPLFERTARGLAPTSAGRVLLAGATKLLAELGDLELRVRMPVRAPMRLRLVCECYTAYHWLPSALRALRETLPDLEIALALEHTLEPIQGLLDGDVDVALVTTATVPKGEVSDRRLFSDEIVFVVGRDHPLASRKTLTRADLRAYPILTGQSPQGEVRWFTTRVFGRTKPRLRVERFPLTEAIVDVARAGMGIAVLTEWIAQPHLASGDLVAKRLASGPILRPWRIAWRNEIGNDAALRVRAALEASVPVRGRTPPRG